MKKLLIVLLLLSGCSAVVTIDNTPMKGIVTPESVMAVAARWK